MEKRKVEPMCNYRVFSTIPFLFRPFASLLAKPRGFPENASLYHLKPRTKTKEP